MGKWTGYFTPSSDMENRVFSYEMEIIENANHQLNVKTVSKLSNDFSAKAIANGLYSPNTGLVSIQENHFDELKMNENLQACLMTNYLTYKNIRGHEVIEGTYTSSNIYTKKDCGGGTVYLEKIIPIAKQLKAEKTATQAIAKKIMVKEENGVPKIENKKMDTKVNTLAKVNSTPIINTSTPISTNTKINTSKNSTSNTTKTKTNEAPVTEIIPSPISDKNSNSNNSISKLSNAAISKPSNTPIQKEVAIATAPQINKLSIKESTLEENEAPIESNIESPDDIIDNVNIKQGNTFQSIPWVLVGRVNKLVKKITTSSPKFSIDLYDNGTIDNDTIIVYDNKQLIVNRKRLSYKAIHVEFTFTNNIREHEVIIVAHNMGQVPPNTALLVLKDGSSRQELYITSTNKMNAKLIIEYSPPN